MKRFNIIALVVSMLVVTVFTVSCGTSSAVDNVNDRFWMISPVSEGPAKTQAQAPTMFWRTHTEGNTVLGYELCDPSKLVFTATGTAAKQWVLETNAGNLNATIDDKGALVVTQLDGTPYARGQRILNSLCSESKLPLSITRIENIPPSEQVLPGEDGAAPIVESGRDHVEASRGESLSVVRVVAPTPGKPDTHATIGGTPQNPITLTCKTAPLKEEAIRDLTDSPALSLNPQLWPGNMLQGRSLGNGRYTPITIARSGGEITLTGIRFADGGVVSKKVDVMDKAHVTQAIQDLLNQPIASQATVVSFDSKEVYSNDQLAFSLGVDGRYAAVSFTANLNIDQSSQRNYVLARFTQIFYTVTYTDPEDTYSVFRDGTQLKDGDNQIGKGNPPLYIANVSYGRQIYFLASSTKSALEIKAALEGAYGSKDAGNFISVNTSSDYKTAMEDAQVSYFSFGGGTSSVTPIRAAPSEMFDAVKRVMADLKSAQVGGATQGLPLSYTVNYLTTREVAQLGYATAYDQTKCQIDKKGFFEFAVDWRCVDDYGEIAMHEFNTGTGGELGRKIDTIYKAGTFDAGGNPKAAKNVSSQYVPLDLFLGQRDKDYLIRISEYNIAGPWCSNFAFSVKIPEGFPNAGKTFYLDPSNRLVDGVTVPGVNEPLPVVVVNEGWGAVGTNSDWRIVINPVLGLRAVLQH